MGLGIVDIVLLVLSLMVSIIIGVYHSIKGFRITPLEYLLGSQSMKPLPLAMSLTVGTVSAITIMGNAGEVYTNGTQLWLMDIGMAVGMFFVAKVLIPTFYPLHMVSLYQYIEARFGSKWFRRATVFLTIFGGVVFIGFLIIPPSLFFARITGLPMLANVAIVGIGCSLYSAFGGVKAVVYTDVFQSIIMIIGALAMVIQGSIQVGGIGEVWNIANQHGRIEFFNFDMDPYQRHSFWLVLVHGLFFSITTYGVNQNQTQRAFCTGSVKYAQRVMYYTILGMLLLKGLFSFSGLVIFANYVDCDPLTAGKYPLPNMFVSVSYVTDHLTKIPGLAGLFVSAIYAAVLSSVSTQVNSITALIWEDFLKHLAVFRTWNENKVANFQKFIALLTGLLSILVGLVVSNFNSFLRVVFKFTGAIWSPMLGLFFVALFLPWVKVKGAAPGFITGIVISVWIAMGQFLSQNEVSSLPTSTDGCGPFNMTQEFLSGNDSAILLIETMPEPTRPDINHGEGFYGISYCLNHIWGAIACILLSIIITVITGPNKPEDIEHRLIHPVAWKWFSKDKKLNQEINLSRGRDSNRDKDVEGDAEEMQHLELQK